MKRLLVVTLISAILLSACGAKNMVVDGKTYTTYGLFNVGENRNPNIQYEISGWSIIWSVIFSETVVVPVYFIGFDLYQPIGKRDASFVPGQVK